MAWNRAFYWIPPALAATALALFARYLWQRRAREAWARTAALVLLANAEWMLGYALELNASSLQAKLFWTKLQFFGTAVIPSAWLVFTLQFSGRTKWLTRRNLAVLSAMPIVILALVFTNEAHGLMWGYALAKVGDPFLSVDKGYAVGFWGFFVYAYTLVLLGAALLMRTVRRSHLLLRRQPITLLYVALFAAVGIVSSRLSLTFFPNLRLEPLAFVLIGVIVAWGFFHLRLTGLRLARDAIIEGMGDGVIVLDTHNRVVDLNPAAQQIVGLDATAAAGRSVARILGQQPALLAHYYHAPETRTFHLCATDVVISRAV
jgi:PAS domain-containing protein